MLSYAEFCDKFNIRLDAQQAQAVQCTDRAVLLLAVPGSGKTTTLITRAAYLVYCMGIAPENILTMTYTVAASAEMRARFSAAFGEEYAKRLEFSHDKRCVRVDHQQTCAPDPRAALFDL